MPTLLEKIEGDFRQAMKNHDAAKVSTLRMLMAAVKNAAIAARTSAKQSIDDQDVEGVVRSEVKKIKDAMVDFGKAARHDLMKAAEAELDVLKGYLPKAMEESELNEIVLKKVAALGAEGVTEFGKVMKAVMEEVQGRADGQAVSASVKHHLEKK